MKIYLTLTTTVFLLFNTNLAFSESSPKLYQNYNYNTPRSEIKKIEGTYDCSEDFEEGALCLDEQKFVGEDVEIGFRFLNNKLVSIILGAEYSEANYIEFFGAINSKFQLVTIESNNEKIDLLVQSKKHKQSVFLKKLTDFEQKALNNGDIKYTFIEKNTYNKLKNSSDNATELMLQAESDVRAIEYILSESEDSSALSLIQFSLPKKYLELIQKKSEKKYKDF